jgi:hypothetical protein
MSLIFRTWMRLAATDKQQSWMLGDNKQTNQQTNSFTDKVKVEWDEPRAIQKRLVYQMPVQGRRTILLDAITQAHSTAHMEQNATRIIPLPDSLLPGTFFFHPFMDFYIFHREPVGLLGFFCGLIFFSLQPSIGGIWVYFWDLYLFRVWLCWTWHNFGYDFGLVLFYVIFWFHFRTLSFFSVSPLGL